MSKFPIQSARNKMSGSQSSVRANLNVSTGEGMIGAAVGGFVGKMQSLHAEKLVVQERADRGILAATQAAFANEWTVKMAADQDQMAGAQSPGDIAGLRHGYEDSVRNHYRTQSTAAMKNMPDSQKQAFSTFLIGHEEAMIQQAEGASRRSGIDMTNQMLEKEIQFQVKNHNYEAAKRTLEGARGTFKAAKYREEGERIKTREAVHRQGQALGFLQNYEGGADAAMKLLDGGHLGLTAPELQQADNNLKYIKAWRKRQDGIKKDIVKDDLAVVQTELFSAPELDINAIDQLKESFEKNGQKKEAAKLEQRKENATRPDFKTEAQYSIPAQKVVADVVAGKLTKIQGAAKLESMALDNRIDVPFVRVTQDAVNAGVKSKYGAAPKLAHKDYVSFLEDMDLELPADKRAVVAQAWYRNHSRFKRKLATMTPGDRQDTPANYQAEKDVNSAFMEYLRDTDLSKVTATQVNEVHKEIMAFVGRGEDIREMTAARQMEALFTTDNVLDVRMPVWFTQKVNAILGAGGTLHEIMNDEDTLELIKMFKEKPGDGGAAQ